MRIAFVALAAAGVLAGCSGGSGGSSPNVPSPNVSSQSFKVTPDDAAQLASEATFGAAQAAESESAVSSAMVGAGSVARRSPASFGNLPYGVCVPDGTYAGLKLQSPQTSGNQTTFEITYYYDPACAQAAYDIKNVGTAGSGTSSDARTATKYDRSGNVLAQRSGTIVFTNASGTLSIQAQDQVTFGGSTTPAGFGENQWSVAPGGSPDAFAINGSGARVTNLTAASYGHSAVRTGTKTVNGDGSVTYAYASTPQGYKGAPGSLSLSPFASPPYSVLPASASVGTGSLTWTLTYDEDGLPVNIAGSGTFANGNVLNVITSAGPPIVSNGSVTGSSGAAIATFQVDQFGNGSISFADGTKRTVIDWHAFK